MIFKAIGSVVLLLCGAGTAWTLVRREKRKLAMLDAWIRLTDTFCEQVRAFGIPASEFLVRLKQTNPRLLAVCGGTSVSELLNAAQEELPQRGQAAIRACLVDTGNTREDQIARLTACKAVLSELAGEAREAYAGRVKLDRVLPPCVAAILVVLLW